MTDAVKRAADGPGLSAKVGGGASGALVAVFFAALLVRGACSPPSSTDGVGYVIALALTGLGALAGAVLGWVVAKGYATTLGRRSARAPMWVALGLVAPVVASPYLWRASERMGAELETQCRINGEGVKVDSRGLLSREALSDESLKAAAATELKARPRGKLDFSFGGKGHLVTQGGRGLQVEDIDGRVLFDFDLNRYDRAWPRSALLVEHAGQALLFTVSPMRAHRSVLAVFRMDGTVLYEEVIPEAGVLARVDGEGGPLIVLAFEQNWADGRVVVVPRDFGYRLAGK